MKNKKPFIIIGALLVIGAGILILYTTIASQQNNTTDVLFSKYSTQSITISNIPLTVWVADTDTKRTNGLSYTQALPNNTGMLFVFDTYGYWGIWMKDMQYPIDVFWLNDNFEIVHSVRNMQPSSYPTVFRPDTPVRYILETNSNTIPE